MTKRILVDSDAVLDLFLDREPHHAVALRFFSHLQRNQQTIEAYVSPVAVANVEYLLSKANTQTYAINKIRGLRNFLSVAAMDQKVVDQAISNPHRDFEDSLQYHCALARGLGWIVTRNGRDFLNEGIEVVTPEEFMAIDYMDTSR